MSSTTNDLGAPHVARDDHSRDRTPSRRLSTETKASFKTSELAIFVLAVLGVLIASAIVDSSDFGPQEAWRYITYLTVGYLLSRGLAKSGSRDMYDESAGGHTR